MKSANSVLPPPPSMIGSKDDLNKAGKLIQHGAVKLRRKPFSMLSMPAAAKISLSPSSLGGHQQNSHIIMNNNAMFLLDLASASNVNLIPPALKQQQQQPKAQPSSQSQASQSKAFGGARSKHSNPSSLSSVSELAQMDPNPFPIVSFQVSLANFFM